MTRSISKPCIALAFIVLAVLVFTHVPAIDAGPPVQVDSAVPDTAEQGTIELDVEINGKGFDNGSSVDFWKTGTTADPGGVEVKRVAHQSSKKLVATIGVRLGPEEDLGAYDIEVITSRGRRGKGIEKFSVVKKGNPRASDIPVCATLGDPPLSSSGGIFNDGDGDYCHDLINQYGIYAFFQHEAGETSDLWVNLIDTDRVFWVDFSDPLSGPDLDCIPSSWFGATTTGWRFFVDEVDNVPVEPDSWDTGGWDTNWTSFCGDSFGPSELCDSDLDGPFVRRRGVFWLYDNVKNVTFELRFQMADWQDFDVNVPSDTSYLKVYHPDTDRWEIKPELIGSDAVVTLLRNGKGRHNTTSCGQFSMPFEITVWPE